MSFSWHIGFFCSVRDARILFRWSVLHFYGCPEAFRDVDTMNTSLELRPLEYNSQLNQADKSKRVIDRNIPSNIIYTRVLANTDLLHRFFWRFSRSRVAQEATCICMWYIYIYHAIEERIGIIIDKRYISKRFSLIYVHRYTSVIYL